MQTTRPRKIPNKLPLKNPNKGSNKIKNNIDLYKDRVRFELTVFKEYISFQD